MRNIILSTRPIGHPRLAMMRTAYQHRSIGKPVKRRTVSTEHKGEFENEGGNHGPDDGFLISLAVNSAANSPYGEGDLFVSPDGSFLIVSCYDHPENIGGESLDLWVIFRTVDDSWTEPANLGPPINTVYGENCPAVSPDGRFLFFNRYTGEEGNDENGTYWVDARILDQFRPEADEPAG